MVTKARHGIGYKLGMLLAILVVITAITGVAGVLGIAGVRDSLATKTRNTADIGEVARLMEANRAQLMLALQHDPASTYAKLHDHKLELHLDSILANKQRLDAVWADYLAQSLSAVERKAAEQAFAARARYVNEGLQPALAAIRSGDFNQANILLLQ